MEKTLTSDLNWPLILGLSTIALVRPLFSIVGLSDELGKPATPLILTVAVTVVWVLIVGLSRVRRPVATLVAAGVGYAVASTVLSAILSPIIGGEVDGPLANPIALVPIFLVNVLWGLIAGGLALMLQRMRGVSPSR